MNIAVHYRRASQPPEWQLTGMPTARAKKINKRRKRILFIVATKVVASQPPQHRPTGTPHAWAKSLLIGGLSEA